MHRATAFIVLAISLVMAFFALTRERPPRKPPTPAPTASSSATATGSTSPFPLTVGNRWEYRETRRDPKTGQDTEGTVALIVAAEDRRGVQVVEERNGKMANGYVAYEDAEGVHSFETETSATASLLFPARLEAGAAWSVSKVARAHVVRQADLAAGGRALPCFEVAYERFYGPDFTDRPGWFPDGMYWVSPGVGIVKKDHTGAVLPSRKDKDPVARGADGGTWELQKWDVK